MSIQIANATRLNRGTILALLLAPSILAACGSVAASEAVSAGTADHARVVHDPENPYWSANNYAALTTQRGVDRQVVHDPESPYWSGNTVAPDTFADPVRGPR